MCSALPIYFQTTHIEIYFWAINLSWDSLFFRCGMEEPNLLGRIGSLSIDAVRTSPHPTMVVPPSVQNLPFLHPSFFRCLKLIPNSLNCASLTGAGASMSGHPAVCVFGKAMTSRIELAFVINITIRSRPKAIPP